MKVVYPEPDHRARDVGCGKQAFDTAVEAMKVRDFVLKRPQPTRKKRGKVEPYLCEFCGKYHIGHAIDIAGRSDMRGRKVMR